MSGRGRGGGGRGRMGGPKAAGPSGYCICPNCNTKTPHQVGIPCTSQNCPNCGTRMIRQ